MSPNPFDAQPPTVLSPEADSIINELKSSPYSVLVGPNNCGKSFVLKSLAERYGDKGQYLGPQRYQNFNMLAAIGPNRRKKDQYRRFLETWGRQAQNIDNSPLNLQQAISELDDTRRELMMNVVGELLGSTLEIRRTIPDNSMSQQYITVDGYNISFTSSGFRLLATVVTSLLDVEFEAVFLDEPELGISPELQGALSAFLANPEARKQYFPHLKTVILASHSSIFLDRRNIGSNISVSRVGNSIHLTRVDAYAKLNEIHFRLLGNRFETLFLPSVIILVEGKSDYLFIKRALSILYPDRAISVVNSGSDSEIQKYLHTAREMLGEIRKSPYRDRFVVVLDSTHARGLIPQLERMGVERDNIIVWDKNGIEYVYPVELVDQIYGGAGTLTIEDDCVIAGGLEYRKFELCEKVVDGLSVDTAWHPEFRSKLISKIDSLLGVERAG